MISVILPTRRPQHALEAMQTFAAPGVEVIVVCPDTDIDGAINIRDAGQGPFPAWADGYVHATGEYIAWLCDDCRLTPGALNEMVKFLAAESGPFIAEFEVGPECYHNGQQFARWGVASRATITAIGGFFHRVFFASHGDVDMSLRCWKAGGRVATCKSSVLKMTNRKDDEINISNFDRFRAIDQATFDARWGTSV